jgi:hypothetical protein
LPLVTPFWEPKVASLFGSRLSHFLIFIFDPFQDTHQSEEAFKAAAIQNRLSEPNSQRVVFLRTPYSNETKAFLSDFGIFGNLEKPLLFLLDRSRREKPQIYKMEGELSESGIKDLLEAFQKRLLKEFFISESDFNMKERIETKN